MAELAIGEPFPAHTLVLCGGSPRFQAQVDRWTQGAQASGTKPVLRVPLGSAEELPHALATVQFMYTGTLGVCRASDLLQVWRMAAYLQVEGCQLECLAALRTLIFRNMYMLPWSTSAPMPPVLDGVSELYSNRHRIPDATVDPSFVRGLKDACRAHLAVPQAYAGTAPAVSPGGPTVGELLAWAFEDAPTVLNDAGIRQQMRALPLAAIEALLSSASFATDDEATVVLMVAFWMLDKDQDDDTDERLSKLIRVAQLNATYLHRVLPHLSWFPIARADYSFLCEYACATDAKKRALIEIKGLHPDCLPAWYALNPRPKPSRASYARGYEWAAPPPLMTGKSEAGVFESADSYCVFLDGFGWQPLVELEPGSGAASVHLKCWRLPDALQLDDELIQEELLVAPQDLRLAIYKWAGGWGSGQLGERQLAWSETFRGFDYIKLDGSICIEEALPLAVAGDGEQQQQQQQQQPADPLVAWRPYLRDGKLRGALTRCCAD